VDITPKPMTDNQWRYWEECAERPANENPAGVRSAQRGGCRACNIHARGCRLEFCVGLMRRLRTSRNI
jgi:hypothetical protein